MAFRRQVKHNNITVKTERRRAAHPMGRRRQNCLLRWNAFDVEVRKRDVDLFVVAAVEEIVALGVAWVEAGVVG